MPPRAKPVKPTNKMDPAVAAAAALKTPIAGPSARPLSATAVPSKSASSLFSEEDSGSLGLSAKLAAIRIEQDAGRKADNGKGKEAIFKDVVSDVEGKITAEDDEGDSSGGVCRHILPNGKKSLGWQVAAMTSDVVGFWKVEAAVQEGLACRACDCFGEPLVGCAETSAILDLDKVEPLMVWNGRVFGVGGLPEVRLRCSELCAEDRIPPFKQLRMLFGVQQGVMLQQVKWTEEWGKAIDWRRFIRVRDSVVLSNRAQNVLLRLHFRNLQVGVRLRFLKGVACPHRGGEETA
ncbi:unnamed protein product [Closterium sp. Naga37s-1]|nr:unnamed protein product [Closterium sp. Naga37s-1]